jgi:hypothetical protein
VGKKTPVIEQLFDERWDSQTRILRDPVVTLADVGRAIRDLNQARGRRVLSDRNLANFFKDFVRNKLSANRNWPASVLDRGYTGRQLTGGGSSFEFVPLPPGQSVAFVGAGPTDQTPVHRVQSASMPLSSRRLGRSDESWLAQIAVRLHLIETHLAIFSVKNFVQVDHLQMGVKLGRSEIDALYLAIEEPTLGHTREVIVSCEVKGRRDDILEDQIISQVQAVFRLPGVTQDVVLPVAIKAIRPSTVYVVLFGEVMRADAATLATLTVDSEAVYEFHPPIHGVGR